MAATASVRCRSAGEFSLFPSLSTRCDTIVEMCDVVFRPLQRARGLRYDEDLGTALTRDELRHVCRVPGLQQDHFHLLGLHLLDERGQMLRRRGNPWPVLDDPPLDQPERGVEVWPAIVIADDLGPAVGREDGLPTV